jgi:hypothetical protein
LTKFEDYWSGVGLDPYPAMDLRERRDVEEIISQVRHRDLRNSLDLLMRACPFL